MDIDLASQFKELAGDLLRFRSEITELEQNTENPTVRQLLKQIGQEWEQQTAELNDAFPKAMAELDEQRADIEKTLDEARATVEKGEAELARVEAEGEAAVEMPMPDLAAPVAPSLRDELLDLFGIPPHAAPPKRDTLGSVADLASGSFASTDAAPAPPKPNPPRPPATHPQAKPKKEKGKDDLWEMTSGDWSPE